MIVHGLYVKNSTRYTNRNEHLPAAVGVNSSLECMITVIGSLIGAGACSPIYDWKFYFKYVSEK